jgi:tetraacyldisaccharide 4'-kinase
MLFIQKLKYRVSVVAKVPIISVGNISFGGTSKTPFVIYLCKLLKELGYKPAVIGRGYKRKDKNDVVVSDGKQILVDASTGGDEMVLIANKTKIPVFAGNSKSNVVEKMNNNDAVINYDYGFDCIVVDDGFQHRRLHRNLDIVLVDKVSISKSIFKRESIKALERADLIVCSNDLTKKELINRCNVKLKMIITAKKINAISYNLFDPKNSELLDNKVIALVGIAKPQRFLDTLKCDVINTLKYLDHHYYTEKDIKNIINKCKQNDCNLIVTTEKDAVILFPYKKIFIKNNVDIIVFPIELQIKNDDKDLLEKFIISIFKKYT